MDPAATFGVGTGQRFPRASAGLLLQGQCWPADLPGHRSGPVAVTCLSPISSTVALLGSRSELGALCVLNSSISQDPDPSLPHLPFPDSEVTHFRTRLSHVLSSRV